MLKIIDEVKLIDRFWRNVRQNANNEIISSRPGPVSRWIFPVYTIIIIIILSIAWFIHHPEIVIADGIITGTKVSGNMVWADVELQGDNLQKITSGQSVQMRFNEYPSARFGMVPGALRQVTRIPVDKKVMVHVWLPDGLTTNRKRSIPFKEGAKVNLLIIIKDMRLIQRIWHGSAKA